MESRILAVRLRMGLRWCWCDWDDAAALEGGTGAGFSACNCDGSVYAEHDSVVYGEYGVSYL